MDIQILNWPEIIKNMMMFLRLLAPFAVFMAIMAGLRWLTRSR